MIRIGRCWYPVTVLGYGKRLGVWFQGCKKDCPNCISPEFQGTEDGLLCTPEELLVRLPEEEKPDGLTISGGEPFDQPDGLLALVRAWQERVNDDILVFTGYTLEELQERHEPVIDAVLQKIAVLVDGRYREEENTGVGLRGSKNQNIHIWKWQERHQGLETTSRSLQCVLLQDCLWMIGIPPK